MRGGPRSLQASMSSPLAKMPDYVVREPFQLRLQRLELQHEQLDACAVERLDAFDDLAVTADQPRECPAVGADATGAGQHLVHLGVGVGARRDLGPPLGVDKSLQILQLG